MNKDLSSQGSAAEGLELRREILRARLIPEAIIEKLATRRESFFNRKASVVLAFSSIVLATIAVVVIVSIYSRALKTYIAVLENRPDTILFHYSEIQGFSVLALMLSVFVLPFWIINIFLIKPKPYPAPDSTASALRTMSGLEKKEMAVRPIPKRLRESSLSEEAFIWTYNVRVFRFFTLMLVIPLCIGSLIFVLGKDYYWLLKSDVFSVHRFGSVKSYSLNDVKYVSVGCNEVKGQGDLVYSLHFKDRALSLSEGGDNLKASQLFDRIATIDLKLRAKGTRFVRWRWLVQNPMAPKCLEYWAEQAGQEGEEKVSKILSVSSGRR